MKISGFTFVKNVDKLYYPLKASIESILPLLDEFVIALGDCDPDDQTRNILESIQTDKIKIIDTIWDTETYRNGTEYARQTDIAKKACTGDWLFYLQADEVIHEKYLPVIQNACEKYLNDNRVEGFLFKYKHFWGDYGHFLDNHGWYPREIRIVRNRPDIHSFGDAQSFRRIPNFDGKSYRDKKGTHKLQVILLDAFVFHYGWVRPPQYMQTKKKALATAYRGEKQADYEFRERPAEFDYGPLGLLAKYEENHPKVMKDWIAAFDWGDKLNYSRKRRPGQSKHQHEKLKIRLVTFIEKKILGYKNKQIGYKNWKVMKG